MIEVDSRYAFYFNGSGSSSRIDGKVTQIWHDPSGVPFSLEVLSNGYSYVVNWSNVQYARKINA